MTKQEAEKALAKLHEDLRGLDFPEMDFAATEKMVRDAEAAYEEGRFHDALDLANAGRQELDMAGQQVITTRFMDLRNTVDLGFSYTPPELMDRIVEGELAMSTDISEAARIADELEEEARRFILDSRSALQEVVDEVVREDDITPELKQAMEGLQQVDGGLDDVRGVLKAAIGELEKVYNHVAQAVAEQQAMVERALQDMGPISGMWDQSRASLRRGDYRQAFDTLYRIYEEMDEILRQGIDYAHEFISYRHKVLEDQGIRDPEVEKRLEDMQEKMEENPYQALEIFLELDDMMGTRESDMVSGIIDSLSEMIQIGRRVGHDIGPVIVGLDEARHILSSGDLEGALDKVREVESVLKDMMPGFIEMRDSFAEMERLADELDRYDIDMREADKRIEWGREMALRGDFSGAHEMIQEALGLIKGQALEYVADDFLECQMGLLSGFRMEAELPEETERLDELFQDVSEGRFKGRVEAVRELAESIDLRLGEKAAESVDALRGDIEAHRGKIEVGPYEEMLSEAEAMTERGEHEQAHVHVWTARKKITGNVTDSLERHVRKIKDLIATGEYVNVDVSAHRREMYSLSTMGRRVRLEDVDKAKDLESRLADTVFTELQQRVEELHNTASRHAAEGTNLDEQLSKLKSARRHLRAGELRRGHELSRESKIELEIATILHGEVYSNMLRLDRIIEREDDRDVLDNALLLLHNGKFRDADISTKRLMRSIFDRGSRAAATEMLSQATQVQDAVRELGIDEVSLRESIPQAEFFLESEDYRLASSLLEKAVRAGRAEIASSLKENFPRLRDKVEGVRFRPREEGAVKEMISHAESMASGPEPERALDIITALRREAERRKEIIDSIDMTQFRNRLSVGDAERIGYEVGSQEELQALASDVMMSGEFCLARGISERAVDQVGELIDMLSRSSVEEAMEDDELSGPDLEKDLAVMDTVRGLVSERWFHAAGDVEGLIGMAKGRTSQKRDMVRGALRSLSELRDYMAEEGMHTERAEAAIKQVEEWTSRGTFISAYVLTQSHHINLNASLDAYIRIKPRVQRFRQMMEEAPARWGMRSYIEALEGTVALVSKGDSDGGIGAMLELEDAAQRRMHELRHTERARITEMAGLLAATEAATIPEHDAAVDYENEPKWMQTLRLVGAMSPRRRSIFIAEGRSYCRCGSCPSYTAASAERGEAFFCWEGGSGCIGAAEECLCAGCYAARMMGVEHARHCVAGSERDQHSRNEEPSVLDHGRGTVETGADMVHGLYGTEEAVIEAVGMTGHDTGLTATYDDHALLELSAELRLRCDEAVDSMLEAVEERGPAADLAAEARLLRDDGAWEEALWRAKAASCVQGLEEERARVLVEQFDECRRRIDEAEAQGVDLKDHRGMLWSADDPSSLRRACHAAAWAMERIERSFLPRLDIELRDGYLRISNINPAMAVDLRIDGRPLAEKLGIGEEVVYPAIKGRGFAEISYLPLLSERRRTRRVLI